MKRLLRFTCAASIAAICSTTLLAQTWETVLNFQLAPGKSADGDGIAADSLGNVFTAGNGLDAAGIYHGLVLKTDTTQAVWDFSDDTNSSATQYNSYLWNIGLDANGNVYSVGQLTPNSTGVPYWYIRKSPDRGLHWSTVDLYQYAAGKWVDATGFAADSSGNTYIVGWGRDTGTKKNPSGNIHWLVKKSADAGQTWALVDDVQGPTANTAAFMHGAGIFVGGDRYASSSSSWLVRRSVSGNAGSWSTVDGPITGGAVGGIASDTQGNIYVAGMMYIGSGTSGYYAWRTRKSSDGGNTWQTVDTFAYAANKNAAATAAGRNSAGNVVVAGYAYDSQNVRHWIVRTPDSSGAWQTIDDFQLQAGRSASAVGVTSDAVGNLLVTGAAQDGTGNHCIVRRLAP